MYIKHLYINNNLLEYKMAEILSKIRLASQPAAQWDPNLVLLLGQKGIETDTYLEKTGDGITPWSALPYLHVRAEDIVGGVNGADGTVILKGTWDASMGSFPAPVGLKKGWAYRVSFGGTVDGVTFLTNDLLICVADCACTDSATKYIGNWYRNSDSSGQQNTSGLEVIINKSTSITADKDSNVRYPTVKSIYDWGVSSFIDTSSTQTITNKRITYRVGEISSSDAPTINTDMYDFFNITALSTNIISMSTNMTGTPTPEQCLIINITSIQDRLIEWGNLFESSTVMLPTEVLSGVKTTIGLIYNNTTNKWRCIGVS